MTTTAVSGKAGVVNIGGVVTEVTEWTLEHNVEALEATSMSSGGNREFVAGLEDWSGTFTTQALLNKTGAQAAATFQVGAAAAAATPVFSGAIIITNEPVATPVGGDTVKYAYTYQGTEALTVATA